MAEKQWGVYILECSDGTLYTGSTDNISRRVSTHNAGKGAKYTRGRTPVILRYFEACDNKSAALKRESAIKKMSRTEKQQLCKDNESASSC